MGKIEKLDWVKVQLTRCCNLKCSFCSQADFRDASTIDADLFIKNVLEVAKPRLLIFTGGEPLAKYDTLKKLLEYCKEHNIQYRNRHFFKLHSCYWEDCQRVEKFKCCVGKI